LEEAKTKETKKDQRRSKGQKCPKESGKRACVFLTEPDENLGKLPREDPEIQEKKTVER